MPENWSIDLYLYLIYIWSIDLDKDEVEILPTLALEGIKEVTFWARRNYCWKSEIDSTKKKNSRNGIKNLDSKQIVN